MVPYRVKKEKIGSCLAYDSSNPAEGKMLRNFHLLTPECLHNQDQKETFTKELECFGKDLAFDA